MPYCEPFGHRPIVELNSGRSIWRYVQFYKFDDMLRGGHLFFTRLRHIVDRETDPFEGSLADINFKNPDVNVQYMLRQVLAPGQPQDTFDAIIRQFSDLQYLRNQQDWVRDHTYVNCWFMDEFESQHMWTEYVPDGNGVAVVSTIRRLAASFHTAHGNVYIQPVIYYDPKSSKMVPPSEFDVPLYKHARWWREQELRCFELAPQSHGRYQVLENIGVWVPSDQCGLIQQVRLAPNAPDDLEDRVRTLLRHSGLDHVPVGPSRVLC